MGQNKKGGKKQLYVISTTAVVVVVGIVFAIVLSTNKSDSYGIYPDSIIVPMPIIDVPTSTDSLLIEPTIMTLDLGYGIYKGEVLNDRPHGTGMITYKEQHIISTHDFKKRQAKRGESVQGIFHNGEMVYGKHLDAGGNLINRLNFGFAD